MAMPGARAYSLTKGSRNSRIAMMGVVNTYLKGADFVDQNLTAVRQSCRATYVPTNLPESDLPFYFGFRIWFPQIIGGTPTLPPPSFEVISVLNVHYINPTNTAVTPFKTPVKEEKNELFNSFYTLNCNDDCL